MNDDISKGEVMQSQGKWQLYDDFAEFLHKYIRENITLADQKAAVIFSIFLFTLLFLLDPTKHLWPNHKGWIGLKGYLNHATVIFNLATVIFLALAELFAFLAVRPRLGSRSNAPIYWGTISQHVNSSAYIDRIIESSHEALVRAKLEHCYELSTICAEKYTFLKGAIYLAILALLVFVIAQCLPILID